MTEREGALFKNRAFSYLLNVAVDLNVVPRWHPQPLWQTGNFGLENVLYLSESYRGTSISVSQCLADNGGSNDRSNLLASHNPCQPQQLLHSATAVFVSGVKQTERKNCHIICYRRHKKTKTHLHAFPGAALYSLHVKLENQPPLFSFLFSYSGKTSLMRE